MISHLFTSQLSEVKIIILFTFEMTDSAISSTNHFLVSTLSLSVCISFLITPVAKPHSNLPRHYL